MSDPSASGASGRVRVLDLLRALRDEALAAVLLAITLSSLIFIYLGESLAQDLSVIGVIALGALALHRFALREKLLLAAALAGSAWLYRTTPDALGVMRAGLDKSAFLCAFMVTVGILKDVAATSPSLRTTGLFLTRQPPSTRYISLASGAHFMATLLNLGTISMLAPLIQSGVDAARASGQPDWMWQAKLRRQLSAALRGFACVIVWTPSTVTQAVLLSVVPMAELKMVILYGIGFAAIVMAAGWAEDSIRWRSLAQRAAAERAAAGGSAAPPIPTPWSAIARFISVSGILIALTLFIHYETDHSIVQSLMLAAPIVTLGWAAEQSIAKGRSRAPSYFVGKLDSIVRRSAPDSSPEAFTLAVAAYIGALLSALVPSELVAAALGPEGLPPIVLLVIPPILIVLANQITIPPIITASFVGAAIVSIDPMPVDPNLLVLSLGAGWALCLTASPYAAPPLVLSRMMGIPSSTITRGWNLGYSAIFFVVLVAWIALLDLYVV